MENMRRRLLSKPPLYPQNSLYKSSISTLKPLKMVTPLPLSEAFENSLYHMDLPKEAGPGEQVVDLNVFPFNPEGHGMQYCRKPPEINYKIIDKNLEESGPCSDQRILTLDEAIENEKCGRDMDKEEERKLRRTISNRLSAQRSRMKKSQYIAEMKKKIVELQENVANLNPKLEVFKQKQTMLKMQKTVLEQQLRRCMNQSILCNRQIEEKKAEIKRLKELSMLKNEQMMMMNSGDIGTVANSANLILHPPERMGSSGLFQSEPKPEPEGMNIDQGGGIEQYLNLEALNFSSTQATDA